MRLLCEMCGAWRSHTYDPVLKKWVCQVCECHRTGEDGTLVHNGDQG